MSSLQELQAVPTFGEARDQELLKDAESYVYHDSPQGQLLFHVFLPPNHNPEAAHFTCILFLHGGLWDMSMPTQFVPHCHHFAARGVVAITAEYRVFNKHRTNPLESLEDAQKALTCLKENAAMFGIDPEQLIVVGAGSGGHLALSLAVEPKPPVSSTGEPIKPAAVVALSAITDTSVKGVGHELFTNLKEAKQHSPVNHLPRKNLPPCLLLHGKQDRVAPFEHVARFAKAYSRKGNKCQLLDYEGAGHTFFNFNTNEQFYELSLNALDNFLVGLDFLSPEEPLVI